MEGKGNRIISLLLALVILAGVGLACAWSLRSRDRDWREALVARGKLLMAQSNPEGALEAYGLLVGRFADDPVGYAGAAMAYRQLGRADEASRLLEQGVGVTGNEELRQLLDESQGQQGDGHAAEQPSQTVQLPAGISWVLEPTVEAEEIRPIIDRANGEGDYLYNHLSAIRVNGKWGLIDFEGTLVLPAQHFDIYRCSCAGEPLVASEYLLDAQYQLTGEPHQAHTRTSGVYCLDQTSGALYYLEEGELTPEPEVPAGADLPVWDAVVLNELEWTLTGLHGFWRDGAITVPLEYDMVRPFHSRLAGVQRGGKWGYVDKDGALVIPLEYEAVLAGGALDETEGLVAVRRGGQMGLLDSQGNEVLPLVFQEVRPVWQGRAWVKQGGKWGILQIG